MAEMGYEYHKLDSPSEEELELQHLTQKSNDLATKEELGPEKTTYKLHPYKHPIRTRVFAVIMYILLMSLLAGAVAVVRSAVVEKAATSTSSSSTQVPQYFQTTPEIYAGPTATGRTPFLAESNPAPFGASRSFVPNTPLETALPIVGDTQNASIFQLMGQLSPYFPNPTGFGVNEYPLPAKANISQVHVLHRHGSRYPTTGAGVQKFGSALSALIKNGSVTGFTGDLAFLNTWSYGLGAEILVPVGRQELFDSGVLHYYDYGHLYNPNSKIIARTTTQDRMLKSAEYFMAATLEVIIEQDGFNVSLAGYDNCNNSNRAVSAGGTNASIIWENTYLKNATARFNALSPHFTWNISDIYNAQTLCPYETVAFGYSAFCDLFTYQEWLGFEYSIDLSFAGNNYFESPTGRAVGIGYVEEFLARLTHHTITSATAQDNITLDNNTVTFPLDQTLYFDFSHDTNMAAIYTAFGLTQFAAVLPTSGPPPNQQLIVSRTTPFGARLDIEIINAPQPVAANRTQSSNAYTAGPPTSYVHFLISQRTVPLGASFAACGQRTDGWCELQTFIQIQSQSLKNATYDYSCNGKYSAVPYGSLTNGVPQATGKA